jgi:hypothetical protein
MSVSAAKALDFEYEVTEANTITITRYTGDGGDVVIPDTIEDKPVTLIGEYAFENYSTLTAITIPDSVTVIGDYAFSSCFSLANVSMGSGVKVIGENAFDYCTALVELELGPSVSIISDWAFFFCSNMESITLPESVTYIGNRAFHGCQDLLSIEIPKKVVFIGTSAFNACQSLQAIHVDPANPVYLSEDGFLFNKSMTTLLRCPGGFSQGIIIPDSVTRIEDYAFYYCLFLPAVSIPDSVTSIGKHAFSFCYSLLDVLIPGSVTTMGDYAFYFCINLQAVFFMGDAPSVGIDPFLDSDQVTVYYIPGTSGWGETFAGRPTAIWNPLLSVLISDTRISNNSFTFTVTGSDGQDVSIEACEDLSNPVWTSIGSITLTGGSADFSDADWDNHSRRYYRAIPVD